MCLWGCQLFSNLTAWGKKLLLRRSVWDLKSEGVGCWCSGLSFSSTSCKRYEVVVVSCQRLLLLSLQLFEAVCRPEQPGCQTTLWYSLSGRSRWCCDKSSHKSFGAGAKTFETPQKLQPLLCLLEDAVGVERPYVRASVMRKPRHLKLSATSTDDPLTEIWFPLIFLCEQWFCCVIDVEREVAIMAPYGYIVQFPPIGSLITAAYWSNVICKYNNVAVVWKSETWHFYQFDLYFIFLVQMWAYSN